MDMWRMLVLVTCLLGIFSIAYLVTRTFILILDIRRKRTNAKFNFKRRKTSVKTMIIAGSGGHTAEMMKLLECIGNNYDPRHYIIASSDKMSEEKVILYEEKELEKGQKCQYCITRVPRSREVKQSWLTSVISTAYACLYSLPIVIKSRPDLVLCNGPGTCIPICAAAFLLTITGWKRVTIVFVESVCRVQTMSLSGKMLYYFADHILVQWPELREKFPLARYIGRIV